MTDTQEILVNKKAYLELEKSHDRLKAAMPDIIIMAHLGRATMSEKATMLECIKEDRRVVETARKALKQAK